MRMNSLKSLEMRGVVFVDLSVTRAPTVKLAGGDPQPTDEPVDTGISVRSDQWAT